MFSTWLIRHWRWSIWIGTLLLAFALFRHQSDQTLRAVSRLPNTLLVGLVATEWAFGNESVSSWNVHEWSAFTLLYSFGIDGTDPRTLLRTSLAGGQASERWLAISDTPSSSMEAPIEIAPAPDLFLSSPPSVPPWNIAPPAPTSPIPPPAPIPPPPPNKNDRPPVFFVYHAHPHESFLPELSNTDRADRAFDSIDRGKTVTTLGARLAKKLNQAGIGAVHTQHPYAWKTAYAEARQTVQEAIKTYETLTYFIDIHRDSIGRNKTTLLLNGKTYAKIVFVIGQKNKNYKKNAAFAQRIHEQLEKTFPGISRGIILKKERSNGEFNQSLSPFSVLVEIGGIENSLEETRRTVDILAITLQTIYWEDQKTVPATKQISLP